MSVTIIDVAKEAGVSRTTVSNVFCGNDKCSQETRLAVLAAAKKLGYKPNLAARSLITNKSRLIAMILPSYVDTNTLTNSPFYNIIMDSVYSVLTSEAFYDLIIFPVHYKERLIQVSDWIDTRNVDGIIALGEFDDPFLKDLGSKSVPVVLIDNYAPKSYPTFSYVNSDDETGGYLATQFLISKGYRNIAICSLELHRPLMYKRYQGYKRALREAKLKEFVFEKMSTPFEAGLHFSELLSTQKVEAAFCTEDMVAIGVMHGMQRKGIKVGQGFGLIGFDNIYMGQQVFPELTTVDQNIFEKGETATKTLLKILSNQGTVGSRMILPVKLIERETA